MGFLIIHVFFLCLNVGLAGVSSISGYSMGAQAFPNYYNQTNPSGTLVANVTNPVNQTTGSPFNIFTQPIQIIQQITYFIVNALTMGFIINAMSASLLHLPAVLMIGIQSVLGILLAVEIIFYWTGRYNFSLS
jgi:hypothetical protein